MIPVIIICGLLFAVFGGMVSLPFIIIHRDEKMEQDRKKGPVEIMKDLLKSNNDPFRISENIKNTTEYVYQKNGYKFSILSGENSIQCTIKQVRSGDILFQFEYDKDTQKLLKQVVSKRIILNDSVDLHIIEKFTQYIMRKKWQSNYSFQIVSDEISDEFFDHNQIDKTLPSDKMKDLLKDITLPVELEGSFSSILKKISFIQENISNFDVEVRHLFEETIVRDTQRLLFDYKKLSDENKLSYHNSVLKSLKNIEDKLNSLEEKIESDNIHGIETTLRVIETRYKK